MPETIEPLRIAVSSYDYPLVILSIAVAVLSAYTVADIAWRTSLDDESSNRIPAYWSWVGGVVLALGAWAAHLIGMLAAQEHFSFSYKIDVTAISVLLVVAGSVSALHCIFRQGERRSVLVVGGAIMGAGLVAMCFTGMHAVLTPGMQHTYNYALVLLSFGVATGFSVPALASLHRLHHGTSTAYGWEKVFFSVLMSGAIIGMHYIDMASMQMSMPVMPPDMDMSAMAGMDMAGMSAMRSDVADNNAMAAAVSAVVVIIVLVALWHSHQYHQSALREKTLLREAREYTDSVLRTIFDGIIIVNDQGVIQSLNPATERVFGYLSDELAGKNISVLMPEPHRSRHDGHIRRYLQSGSGNMVGSGFREVEGLRKDGTVFPLEIAISEVRFGKRRLFSGLVRDITQRKEAEARLVYLAHHDALTGLPSRVLFRDRASRALLHAERAEKMAAILYLDLDHFKDANDNFGHEVGDKLLQAVARRIGACVRAGDTVSRLGGDEFVIVLENLSGTHDATGVARIIIETLAEPFVLEGGESGIRIGASIGIVVYPLHRKDLDGLLKDADSAMYRAKRQGGNDFQVYSPEMRSGILRDLHEDIGNAFERGELRVYYQPRIDLATGKSSDIEALLRWQHPRHGLLEAKEFVPLLEENGQIGAVGLWALCAACVQFRAWLDTGMPLVRLTVNLSALQLRDVALTGAVRHILEETRLPAGCLEFDIPGSYFELARDAHCRARVEELRKLGVHLALEDSYERYSVVEFLNRSPLDTLKLGRDFVRGIHTDRERAAVLKALMAMARALQLRVVAKGVESELDLALLREFQCDAVQGDLFGRVESAEDLSRMFLKEQLQISPIPANSERREKPSSS